MIAALKLRNNTTKTNECLLNINGWSRCIDVFPIEVLPFFWGGHVNSQGGCLAHTTVDGRNLASQLSAGSLSHYLQDFIHPFGGWPDFFHQ